jgi:hypothetical protein
MHIVVFVRKPKVRRPLGKTRRRRKDNIKMCIKAIGWRCFIRPKIGTSSRLL